MNHFNLLSCFYVPGRVLGSRDAGGLWCPCVCPPQKGDGAVQANGEGRSGCGLGVTGCPLAVEPCLGLGSPCVRRGMS